MSDPESELTYPNSKKDGDEKRQQPTPSTHEDLPPQVPQQRLQIQPKIHSNKFQIARTRRHRHTVSQISSSVIMPIVFNIQKVGRFP